MIQPFKVTDRIFNNYDGSIATVTELTEKGFKYELDEPKNYGARIGVATGGECYELGFEHWSVYDGTNKVKPLVITYEPTVDLNKNLSK